MVKGYKFGRTNVVTCQDEFADPIWDPQQKYLSTSLGAIRRFWNFPHASPVGNLSANEAGNADSPALSSSAAASIKLDGIGSSP